MCLRRDVGKVLAVGPGVEWPYRGETSEAGLGGECKRVQRGESNHRVSGLSPELKYSTSGDPGGKNGRA